MIKKYVLVSLIIFLSYSVLVSAHGTGASFEKNIGNYKVDIGYDPMTFSAGQSQRFDFNIYDTKSDSPVNFSDVWVLISQGNKTVFAGGIYKSDLGVAGMTFVFPKEGDYILDVRFENNSNTIVEVTFPITVLEGEVSGTNVSTNKSSFLGLLVSAIIGLSIGFLLAFNFIRKSKNFGKL